MYYLEEMVVWYNKYFSNFQMAYFWHSYSQSRSQTLIFEFDSKVLPLLCRFFHFLASTRCYILTKRMLDWQIMVSHLTYRNSGVVSISRPSNSLLKLRVWGADWLKCFKREDLLWPCILDTRWICWLSQAVLTVALKKKLKNSSGWGLIIFMF